MINDFFHGFSPRYFIENNNQTLAFWPFSAAARISVFQKTRIFVGKNCYLYFFI